MATGNRPEGMKYGMFDDLDIYKSMKGTDYQDEIFGRTEINSNTM